MIKKKISFLIFAILFFIALPMQVYAEWTIDTTVSANSAHWIKFKVVCTSDGDSLTATDLVAEFEEQVSSKFVQGLTAIWLRVIPGTGDEIPNTTINITLTDEEEETLWSETGISKDASTTHLLYTSTNGDSIGMWPPILDKFYLTINDIGDEDDTVTLYFHCWIE